MKRMLSQILFTIIIGLIGLISVNAQSPQKDIKVIIVNESDVNIAIKDVENKDVLNAKAYRFIGKILAKGSGVIYTKTNRTFIVTNADKNMAPYARIKVSGNETELAYKLVKDKSRGGYSLVKGQKNN